VGKVALVQVSAYCCFTLPVIIEPMLNTHVHLHVALTRGANGQSLGTFQNANAFGNREALDRKQLSLTISMVTLKHTSPTTLNININENRLRRKLRGKQQKSKHSENVSVATVTKFNRNSSSTF
jgi:hypothetical protein